MAKDGTEWMTGSRSIRIGVMGLRFLCLFLKCLSLPTPPPENRCCFSHEDTAHINLCAYPLTIFLSWYALSIHLSPSLYIYLSVRLSVHLSIYLLYIYLKLNICLSGYLATSWSLCLLSLNFEYGGWRDCRYDYPKPKKTPYHTWLSLMQRS